ncbi:hypothetical protein [Alterinioella nitratireducens]|jgi:hypothetical protein|uniref:hypothetical protein n=1 Tax=Alterinioella nitratireducens TaxID=2735915 RepID=UPI000C48DACE|nr:hypothetical protein [Alterinioella nitratireducens]MAN15415.1 hypothetical protein [Dinoroseobacter sp.]MAX73207.1 hypothetical protein [Nioella sp.]NPD20303.1 hypothetical protein [Alterinioella nitratireducens]
MKASGYALAALLPLIAACATLPSDETEGTDPGIVTEVPEEVRALAAPNQSLAVVRIMPEDGCYWYQHSGPVENTFLPLRTRENRMICTRPNDPVLAATGG